MADWSEKAWAALLQSWAEWSEACTALSTESRIACTNVARSTILAGDLDRDLGLAGALGGASACGTTASLPLPFP